VITQAYRARRPKASPLWQCLVEFMRTTLGLPDGIAGIVMTIHTFGEYLDFHPHRFHRRPPVPPNPPLSRSAGR